ncbi:MAG: hypothetical protein ABSB78_03610 [Bacteroidota bacterium]
MNTMIEEPEYTPSQKRLFVFGLAAIVLVFYGASIAHFYYTPDETYVYLQYGRNIAHGDGFSFNPHEPAYGVTSPLWTLLIACENFFSIDVVLGTKALDLFIASLGLIVFFMLAIEILRHRILALLATLAFSMNVSFLQWSSSGLETSLAVFLALLAAWYCMRNEYVIGSVIAGLLSLVRPEAILFIVIIIADIFFNTVERRRAIKTVGLSLLAFCLVILPWYIFALRTFGTVLSNSFFADGSTAGSLRGLIAFTAYIGASDAVTAVFFLIGLIIAVRKSRNQMASERTELRMLVLPAGWVIILSVFFLSCGTAIAQRSLLLIIPFITILGFWGMKKIHEEYNLFQRLDYNIFIILTAIILIQNQFVYRHSIQPYMRDIAQGTEDVFQYIASWLETNTSTDAIVTVPDAGVIGYYSHRKICDPMGVVTPEMIKLRHQGYGYNDIMLKRLYFSSCIPDYVIDRASVAERLMDEDLVPLFHRAFYGMRTSDFHVIYYTVYRVRHNAQPKAFLKNE